MVAAAVNSTRYFSKVDWNKLSYEERKKIRKERDKKKKPGCSNKRAISETAAQQLTTVIIRSIYKANKEETGSIGGDDIRKWYIVR